jgi:hypothetical protein
VASELAKVYPLPIRWGEGFGSLASGFSGCRSTPTSSRRRERRAPPSLAKHRSRPLTFRAFSAHNPIWFLRESKQSKSRPMQKIAKLATIALLFAVMTMARVHAQTNTIRTNVLLNLTFKLTGYEQVILNFTGSTNGPFLRSAKAQSIATDGIIRSIAKQAHITNDVSAAKLLYRVSWTNPTNDISQDIIIRRGAEDYVVNNYILVNFPDSVTQERPTATGTTNVTDYANCNVSLGTSSGSFTLHGLATIKSGSLFYNGRLADPTPTPQSFTASVSGSGSIGFHRCEWKGTVMGSGQKIELVQVSP